MAEIRLQMDEMRRQLERRHQMESIKQEQARNEASKDAFFRVMSRSVNVNAHQNDRAPINELTSGSNDAGEALQQIHQITVYKIFIKNNF